MPLGDGALALVRKAVEQLFGDDQRQYPVAEKLQPLVSVPGARLGAGVGHGPAQDVRVPEVVADLAGQSVQIRLRLAHSIPSSNRPPRVAGRHFQTSSALALALVESQINSARPPRLSSGMQPTRAHRLSPD